MALDYTVKVVDVHKDNIKVIWPCLIHSIQSASFIALDCELSGLGDRRLINAQAVDDRYKHIGNVAKTRSIISIGLCCFRSDSVLSQSLKEQPTSITYEVQTFNLMALCAEEYVVEPTALQFLVNHDFDFQKQYSKGIPYYRGSHLEQERKNNTSKNWNLRDFFDALILARVPVVLHNGLVDLVFLYHNLYAELPSSLPVFLADLDVMFPGGIYDTKYIAEFEIRIGASFLEYVFRSCQLHNMEVKHKKQMHICCIHSIPDSEYTDVWDCSPKLQEIPSASEICPDYSNHGHCKNGNVCGRSHDIFRVVMEEKEKKARKRRRKDPDESDERFDSLPHFDQTPSQERFKGHRAGHDAFMTAFSFASFLARKLTAKKGNSEEAVFIDLTKDVRNRICLSGKDFPLLVQKSNFSKNSKGHLARYAKLVPGTVES